MERAEPGDGSERTEQLEVAGGGGVAEEVGAIRSELGALERRLTRIEQVLGLAAEPGGTVPTGGAGPVRSGTRLWLSYPAFACFVLGGALVLRTATHQGWLAPHLGTGLGLAYGLGLLLVPHLWLRRGRLSSPAQALQLSGSLLFAAIVIETVQRGPLPVGAALPLIAVGGALGLLVGLRQRQVSLVALVLLAALAATVGLGLTPVLAPARAVLMVGVGAAALWAAARMQKSFLRPLVILPTVATISLAVILTGQRAEVPRAVAWSFLAAAGALAVLMAGAVALRARADAWERASAPLALLWFAALAIFVAPEQSWPPLLVAGLVLLGAMPRLGETRRSLALFGGGLLVAAALWPSGLGAPLLGAAAIWIVHASTRPAARSGELLFGHGLQLLGVAWVMASLIREGHPARPLLLLSGAAVSASGLVAARITRSGAPAGRWLAGVALCGSLAFALVADLAVARLAGTRAGSLAASLALAAASVACSFGRGRLAGCGAGALLALALLAAKVLVWDLKGLDGAYRIISVLVLGIAALACSLPHGFRRAS